MNSHDRVKHLRFVVALLLVAGLFLFARFDIGSAPVRQSGNKELGYLLKCGYIRRNIGNTIFHPDFVMYLSGQQKKYATLDAREIRNAVAIWNAFITDERKIIRFQREHFRKLALLAGAADEVVTADDIAVLHYWMSDIVAEVAEDEAIQVMTQQELTHLNIEDNRNIRQALEIIREDPVGERLVAYAASRNVTIGAEPLHDHKGYFEYRSNTIVIDPTVADYIFKINGIVHELVHASNADKDNSVFEETLAEMIGMAVQDRLTGIEISCSPYVVFIDRLLDPVYGKYPLRNNIEKHLRRAGIVIKNVSSIEYQEAITW